MAYSYQKESPGYAELVFAQACKALQKLDVDFAALFAEQPVTESERKARRYFNQLDVNEQAALREQFEEMKGKGTAC